MRLTGQVGFLPNHQTTDSIRQVIQLKQLAKTRKQAQAALPGYLKGLRQPFIDMLNDPLGRVGVWSPLQLVS